MLDEQGCRRIATENPEWRRDRPRLIVEGVEYKHVGEGVPGPCSTLAQSPNLTLVMAS